MRLVTLRGDHAAPSAIDAVIFDFDGVMTDNLVYVDETGRESVACSRGDGMGLGRLRAMGIYAGVLSKEKNPVVGARCRKLELPFRQGIDDKLEELQAWAGELGTSAARVAYVGNDVNDLECMAWSGAAIAVTDSEPEVLAVAHLRTVRPGGRGAVRDVCEWLIAARASRTP